MMEFDLHIHSKFSFDSVLEPKTILKVARKKGLSGIAITDHNTIKGAIEALKMHPNDLFIICGAEIETEYGDILGLFLNEEIKSRSFLNVVDEIKEQGGLVILPHPFKRNKEIRDEIIKNIDAIEGLNARTPRILNIRAQELAKANNLPVTAGSDAHFAFEIGRARTIIKKDVNDIEDIKQAIKKHGQTSIVGTESSEYVECFSQIIKMFRRKEFNLLPLIIRKVMWISASKVIKKLKR